MRVTWETSYGHRSVLIIPDSAFEEMDDDEVLEEIESWVKGETDAGYTIISVNGEEFKKEKS